MSAIAEEMVRQYRMPLWLVVTLCLGTGIGIAMVTVIVAALGVVGALAGNGALPEVLGMVGD